MHKQRESSISWPKSQVSCHLEQIERGMCVCPTNIGIVRGTVSVATIVVVNAGVEIWLL